MNIMTTSLTSGFRGSGQAAIATGNVDSSLS